MTVSSDCIEAEPVRERLRNRGYELLDIGFGPSGEVWRHPFTGDVQTLLYCTTGEPGGFLAQSVVEAGV